MNKNFEHPSLVKHSYILNQPPGTRYSDYERTAIKNFCNLIFKGKLSESDIHLFCHLLEKDYAICDVFVKTHLDSDKVNTIDNFIATVGSSKIDQTQLYSFLVRYNTRKEFEAHWLDKITPQYTDSVVVWNLLKNISIEKVNKIIELLKQSNEEEKKRISDCLRQDNYWFRLEDLSEPEIKKTVKKIKKILWP